MSEDITHTLIEKPDKVASAKAVVEEFSKATSEIVSKNPSQGNTVEAGIKEMELWIDVFSRSEGESFQAEIDRIERQLKSRNSALTKIWEMRYIAELRVLNILEKRINLPEEEVRAKVSEMVKPKPKRREDFPEPDGIFHDPTKNQRFPDENEEL